MVSNSSAAHEQQDEQAPGPCDSQTAQVWFDRLELALRQEAELAGLLEHGPTIGDGREFIVRRALKTFLPPAVHVGTGVVVGSGNRRSKHLDIILYDPHFPVLEIQEGVGLYFAEGVIATIEVKSSLTRPKLLEALENCASVAGLVNWLRSPEPPNILAEKVMRERGLSPADTEEAVKAVINPRTYIFSFTSALSTETIAEVVNSWYDARGESRSAHNPGLPRLIVAKGTVGLACDDWIELDGGTTRAVAQRDLGPLARPVMGFYSTPRQFGWLALRLIHDVVERLALKRYATAVDSTIDPYLPAKQSASEELEGKDRLGHYVYWTGTKRPTNDG